MSVEIKVVKEEDELLEYWYLIKKVPLINVLHRDLLVLCLQGKAVMLTGWDDGKRCAVGIVERHGDNMSILALNAKNGTKALMTAFYSWAYSLGVKRLTMMSTFNREAYERLFSVKHLTSIYEKDLTGWQPEQ